MSVAGDFDPGTATVAWQVAAEGYERHTWPPEELLKANEEKREKGTLESAQSRLCVVKFS